MTDETTFISTSTLSQRWGITPQMLANWRTRGEGPPWTKIGKKIVRYRMADILTYEDAGHHA